MKDTLEYKLSAFVEMARRYFDVDGEKATRAFVFYVGATEQGEITDEDIQWARNKIEI